VPNTPVARGTWLDGIFFCEGALAGEPLGTVRAEISRQNANLFLVKTELAKAVRQRGGNALAEFRYGQRSHRPLELLKFKWDTESWVGEGLATRVDDPAALPTDG
jgi:hypothetical protein